MSPRELNENTTVPVKVLVGAVILAAAVVGGWLDLRAEVRSIRKDMHAETWDRTDMAEWSQVLKIRNPEMDVPYVTAKPAPKL